MRVARSREICVVGAGVSGLRAAGLLASAGFNVTVLEARDRVGGRLHQSSAFGQLIDVGASWIHGTEGNPLVSLADKASSTTVACGAVYSIFDSNGDWIDQGTARSHYEEVWEILEMAMEKSKEEYASLSDTSKMMDFFRKAVAKRALGAAHPERYTVLMLQIVEMWGAFMGDDCEHQSLKALSLDPGLEGDNLFLASTYRTILDHLLLPVSTGATIRLGCEVTRISNSQHGVVEIKAADGYRQSFDDVIVTLPLGWLKRNADAFEPRLSSTMSTAIQSIGYGNLDRVFIKFPRAFWDTAKRPSFPVESLYLPPNYATESNPAKWRVEIISFSGLPGHFSQPVLMFFVYGQWGRHITGLVRGMKQDSDEYYRILDNNFQPYYSKLPNYDPVNINCRPSQYMSTDWQGDKFAGYGSFANLPIGSGDCAQHFEILREGMGDDRGIWFAGEHTSPVGGIGTVHGAYWSGEEVARKVVNRCGTTMMA